MLSKTYTSLQSTCRHKVLWTDKIKTLWPQPPNTHLERKFGELGSGFFMLWGCVVTSVIKFLGKNRMTVSPLYRKHLEGVISAI